MVFLGLNKVRLMLLIFNEVLNGKCRLLVFCIVTGLGIVVGDIILDWGWGFFWLLSYVKKNKKG